MDHRTNLELARMTCLSEQLRKALVSARPFVGDTDALVEIDKALKEPLERAHRPGCLCGDSH